MNKAVFLDRDGVLIKAPISKDKKPLSIKNISDLKFLPTVIKTCKILKNKFLLIMITNQPDVSRKKNKKLNVEKINIFIKKKLKLDDVYVCYSKNENSIFKKPNPGMIIKAAKKHKINLKKSYFVGDRWKDIDAGTKVSCKTVFIDRNYNEKLNMKPNFKIKKFNEILKFIKF
tara:strand:- start:712 stop:1230 length:519 start_codon:yes stop_codon:yes gene_type:complete